MLHTDYSQYESAVECDNKHALALYELRRVLEQVGQLISARLEAGVVHERSSFTNHRCELDMIIRNKNRSRPHISNPISLSRAHLKCCLSKYR